MPNRMSDIQMSPEEQARFLEECALGGATMTVGSIDAEGRPHLVAMWYALREGLVHFTSYRRAQKIVNLQRNPAITCLIEKGDRYTNVRGLAIQGRAEVIEDDAALSDALMWEISLSRDPEHPLRVGPEEARRAVSAKRWVVRVHPERVYSWDHRKLGGGF